MVRTLDFHSNNVGSIPASLILMILKNSYTLLKKREDSPSSRTLRGYKYFFYTLNFRSLIPVSTHLNLQSATLGGLRTSYRSPNKLQLKQAYLLLTWILVFQKHTAVGTKTNKLQKPIFFVKPRLRSRFTITKAPMAHKTFSQEQYLFQFYNITTSFKLLIPMKLTWTYNSSNNALQLLLSLHNETFFFETNLFFIQRLSITLPLSAKKTLLL